MFFRLKKVANEKPQVIYIQYLDTAIGQSFDLVEFVAISRRVDQMLVLLLFSNFSIGPNLEWYAASLTISIFRSISYFGHCWQWQFKYFLLKIWIQIFWSVEFSGSIWIFLSNIQLVELQKEKVLRNS